MIPLLRVFLFAALLLFSGVGEVRAEKTHAISMHGAPKYAADFAHLDYVNPDAPKGGTLRLAKTGSFNNLNNHIITGNNAEGLEHVNDRLMQRIWDEPFTMYGLVAQSLDVSDDRSTVTFYLNKKARFHDGVPMTAADIKFSYEALREHGHPVRRRVYGLIDEVKIIDDHTIRFHFGEGYDRESVMILAMLPVLPKHYWEKQDVSKTTLTPPLGSGPYKIESVEPGRKIVYTRVKDWWAKDLPINVGLHNFDTVTYTYFRDDDIALQAFEAETYDLRREQDIAKWMTIGDSAPFKEGRLIKEEIAHQRPEWLKAFIFNTRRQTLSDARVREALGLMFNADWVNKTFFFGNLKRLNSAFSNSELAAQGEPSSEEVALLEPYRANLPPAVFGQAWQPPTSDQRTRQREALKLLAAAGWQLDKNQRMVDAQGQGMQFEILLGDPSEEKVALEFSRALKRIGIQAKVRTVDSAQFTGRLEDFDYDIVLFRWINSLSPGNEQVNYWGSKAAASNGSRNYAGVSHPAVDMLADSIARSEKREELVSRCRALDRVLMHGHYMIPLFYTGRDLVMHATDIRRPEVTPTYGIVLESLWRHP